MHILFHVREQILQYTNINFFPNFQSEPVAVYKGHLGLGDFNFYFSGMGEVVLFCFSLTCPNRLKMFQIFPMMSKGTHVIDLKKKNKRRNYNTLLLQHLPWILAETNDSYGSIVLSQVNLLFQKLPSSVQHCGRKAPTSVLSCLLCAS